MSAAPPLRILILDDRADDAAIISRALRRAGVDCVTQHAESEAEFLASLTLPPELILADYQLPGYDALAALRALRTRGLEVPVIVVSGTIGEEAAVECLREGATDYLLKDRLGRLGQAALNAVERARLRDEQRRTAEALRASEERYRSLVEEAPHPMWVVDAETLRFLEVNRRAVSLYGYSRQEFLAMSLLDIRPEQDIPATLAAVNSVFAGEPRVGEWRHRTKAGLLLEVSVASRPVSFAGRRALLAIVDDVTERRQLERQLRQGQKMEAIGRLAGGIAHDFNNLLTAILGYSGLLVARAGDRLDLLGLAEEVRKSAERAAALTRQLLAFGRQQALHPRVIDLNEVVTGVEVMLRRLLGDHLGFTMTLHDEACPVLADAGQLEQVIVNLAVNARDAMPDGGRLTVATACVELGAPAAGADGGAGAGPHVLLAVSDTGLGMSAETQAHIFEPFFTTKDPGKGTGLGLATVYGIVHQSGGHLRVTSEPNQGSTFQIFLPRAAAAIASAMAPIAPVAPAPPRGDETVLVLEDDPSLRKLVRTLLEEGGYTVLTAGTATAAISLAERHPDPIHLLLSDVVLPGMGGPEAAARLLALRPATRLLYISGYSGDVAGRPNLLPEGARLLGKPFTQQSLLEKVREALDDKPAAGGA
jgi:two-component system cell cycle sensor histidine kinase/response regulator CckA